MARVIDVKRRADLGAVPVAALEDLNRRALARHEDGGNLGTRARAVRQHLLVGLELLVVVLGNLDKGRLPDAEDLVVEVVVAEREVHGGTWHHRRARELARVLHRVLKRVEAAVILDERHVRAVSVMHEHADLAGRDPDATWIIVGWHEHPLVILLVRGAVPDRHRVVGDDVAQARQLARDGILVARGVAPCQLRKVHVFDGVDQARRRELLDDIVDLVGQFALGELKLIAGHDIE